METLGYCVVQLCHAGSLQVVQLSPLAVCHLIQAPYPSWLEEMNFVFLIIKYVANDSLAVI